MRRRLVHFLTGIRSEYDILSPVIEAVNARSNLEAAVIVTGAHLTGLHGLSVRQIRKDGFRIAGEIDSLLASDGLSGRVKGMALQLAGLTDIFTRERPDFMVVMGDREEVMTGAITAIYNHIPLVHIGGGDHATDGNVDNLIRHSVSKLAHLHMATTELSARRLRALGEEDWRIHVTGASGLDRLFSVPHLSRETLEKQISVNWSGAPYAVLLYHPTITDYAESGAHISLITKALEQSGLYVAAMSPNSDPGNQAISDEIADFARRCPRVKAFSYLDRIEFVNLLRHAHVMVGNSSSGVLEAPSLGLPVVNIGVRQRGREHGDNIIFTNYDAEEVAKALAVTTQDPAFRAKAAERRSPYGNGDASRRIADILEGTEIGPRLLNKHFIMEEQK